MPIAFGIVPRSDMQVGKPLVNFENATFWESAQQVVSTLGLQSCGLGNAGPASDEQ